MKKLEFSIAIEVSKERVWDILWSDETYRRWTATFIPGSYYEGELAEGNTILFLSPGQHGLFAVVEKIIPYQAMYFRHFGFVLDGKMEQKSFADESIEYYDLFESEHGTKLTVTINTEEEYIDYFNNSFPRALLAVKELVES